MQADLEYEKVEWARHYPFMICGVLAKCNQMHLHTKGLPISFDDAVHGFEWHCHKGTIIPKYMYPHIQRLVKRQNPEIQFIKTYTEEECNEFEQCSKQ